MNLVQTCVRIYGDIHCSCLFLVRAYYFAPALDPRRKKLPVIWGLAPDTVKVPLSQPCFDHFFGPVLGAMMKQVCWHSSRSKAYRGLPEARGQSEAHGDSTLYTMGVRPCVTAKLPVLGPWFWNLILLNLAAASCYLHGGKVLAAAGSESFMVEKSIAGSGARAEPLQAAAQSVATGISTVLKAPCTDLRSDPTLHQNFYRTTQADAYVNHAHQTQAQRV